MAQTNKLKSGPGFIIITVGRRPFSVGFSLFREFVDNNKNIESHPSP